MVFLLTYPGPSGYLEVMAQAGQSGGYGKRPMWQWVLLYIVIGAIVYGLIYYFAAGRGGGYGSESNTTPPASNGSLY